MISKSGSFDVFHEVREIFYTKALTRIARQGLPYYSRNPSYNHLYE